MQDVLQQYDLRVTGIDWAPKTNRIVTCAAVSWLSNLTEELCNLFIQIGLRYIYDDDGILKWIC